MMNAITLIASTLALGAVMGISGTHFHQVKTMVENGRPEQIVPPSSVPPGSALAEKIHQDAKNAEPQLDLIDDVALPTLSLPTESKSINQRDGALMEILVAIRNEQKNIRQQVSETNRDMDELTFRVDSHSTQFRPLQTKAGRPRALIVNDDEFASPSGSNQLLPPKQ